MGELRSFALEQKASGLLSPNKAGKGRFFRRLDAIFDDACTPLIEALTVRLERCVPGLCGKPRDVALGRVCSYIEPGGFVHEHDDAYPENCDFTGLGHLRANIVVQMEPSSVPMIARRLVPVKERDAWVFLASHHPHGTATVPGTEPRIVFGFGWTVPPDFWNNSP